MSNPSPSVYSGSPGAPRCQSTPTWRWSFDISGVRAPAARQQIRAPLPCQTLRLLPAPSLHRAVVARQEDLGYRMALELRRARVLRVLEKAGGVRFEGKGVNVAEHPGHQSRD